jgi:hypothetical protein
MSKYGKVPTRGNQWLKAPFRQVSRHGHRLKSRCAWPRRLKALAGCLRSSLPSPTPSPPPRYAPQATHNVDLTLAAREWFPLTDKQHAAVVSRRSAWRWQEWRQRRGRGALVGEPGRRVGLGQPLR